MRHLQTLANRNGDTVSSQCFANKAANQLPGMIIVKSQGMEEEEVSVSGPSSLLLLKQQL